MKDSETKEYLESVMDLLYAIMSRTDAIEDKEYRNINSNARSLWLRVSARCEFLYGPKHHKLCEDNKGCYNKCEKLKEHEASRLWHKLYRKEMEKRSGYISDDALEIISRKVYKKYGVV